MKSVSELIQYKISIINHRIDQLRREIEVNEKLIQENEDFVTDLRTLLIKYSEEIEAKEVPDELQSDNLCTDKE